MPPGGTRKRARQPAFIAAEVAQLFTDAIAEAEAGFHPTPAHLDRARRISAELDALRRNGDTFSLAGAANYPALLRFLFRTYTAFQNAGNDGKREPETLS